MRNTSEARKPWKVNITQKIREAIAAQDYAPPSTCGTPMWARSGSELSEGASPRNGWRKLRELFEWGRCALLCARSQNLDRLNAIHVAAAYTMPAIPSTDDHDSLRDRTA